MDKLLLRKFRSNSTYLNDPVRQSVRTNLNWCEELGAAQRDKRRRGGNSLRHSEGEYGLLV